MGRIRKLQTGRRKLESNDKWDEYKNDNDELQLGRIQKLQ